MCERLFHRAFLSMIWGILQEQDPPYLNTRSSSPKKPNAKRRPNERVALLGSKRLDFSQHQVLGVSPTGFPLESEVSKIYMRLRTELVASGDVECVRVWDQRSRHFRDALCIPGTHQPGASDGRCREDGAAWGARSCSCCGRGGSVVLFERAGCGCFFLLPTGHVKNSRHILHIYIDIDIVSITFGDWTFFSS